jgi:hypothetical protein
MPFFPNFSFQFKVANYFFSKFFKMKMNRVKDPYIFKFLYRSNDLNNQPSEFRRFLQESILLRANKLNLDRA